MVSIWEKQSFLKSDVLILGAGIAGLSTAASLIEMDPNLKITILEQGVIPSGASTKNAGFACFGSISELRNDIASLGKEGMVSLVQKRIDGLKRTETRLGAKAIDLQINSGFELLFHDQPLKDEIEQINELLNPIFGKKVYHLASEKIHHFGFDSTKQLIENPFEGQLDTGKLIDSLWYYCTSRGVRIITGCQVLALETHDEIIASTKEYQFQSQKLAICTNAFTKDLLGDAMDLQPGRGMVMAVRPLKPSKIRGTFHYHEGYYYFRDYHELIIFGGGRDLAKEQETTTEFGINEKIKNKLIQDLDEIVLPGGGYQIENTWSGIMAFGSNKSPIVKKLSENTAIGVRLGGMGIAIGSLVGEEVAQLLLN